MGNDSGAFLKTETSSCGESRLDDFPTHGDELDRAFFTRSEQIGVAGFDLDSPAFGVVTKVKLRSAAWSKGSLSTAFIGS